MPTALEIADAVRSGRTTARQVVEQHLAVIEAADGEIHAAPAIQEGLAEHAVNPIGQRRHRQDGGGAEYHPGHHQRRLPGTPHHLAVGDSSQQWMADRDHPQDQVGNDGKTGHGQRRDCHRTNPAGRFRGASMRPSRMRTSRAARSATKGLWVTSTMV